MIGYIDDGYTRTDGYIAAAPSAKSGERLWEPLEFTYRIATRREVIRHDAEVRSALRGEDDDPECAVKAELLACKFVAERIKEWNLRNRGHHPVPISEDACSRMQAQLFGTLYRIVRGTQVSDPKPSASEVPAADEELQKN
jgi:hypothetical protein